MNITSANIWHLSNTELSVYVFSVRTRLETRRESRRDETRLSSLESRVPSRLESRVSGLESYSRRPKIRDFRDFSAVFRPFFGRSLEKRLEVSSRGLETRRDFSSRLDLGSRVEKPETFCLEILVSRLEVSSLGSRVGRVSNTSGKRKDTNFHSLESGKRKG